jgi:8-oxo-dGTP diphosphatase
MHKNANKKMQVRSTSLSMKSDRFKVIPGVALMLKNNQGKTLLLRRANTGSWDGYFCHIGGGVDGNETLRQAAIREAHEEAGITIQPDDLRLIHVNHRPSELGEIVLFIFEVLQWHGEPYNKEPHKHDMLDWYLPDQLPGPFLPWVKPVYQAGDELYSEFGWTAEQLAVLES